MPKKLILIDFDGTLTNVEGNKLIRQSIFGNCFKPPLIVPSAYTNSAINSPSSIAKQFKQEKSPNVEPFLLNNEAVDFLKNFLDQDEFLVSIISKNRKSYIEGILQYHQFSIEQILQLHIHAIDEAKTKPVLAVEVLKNSLEECEDVFIIDDSSKDINEIVEAIKIFKALNNLSFNIKSFVKGIEWSWEDTTTILLNSAQTNQLHR